MESNNGLAEEINIKRSFANETPDTSKESIGELTLEYRFRKVFANEMVKAAEATAIEMKKHFDEFIKLGAVPSDLYNWTENKITLRCYAKKLDDLLLAYLADKYPEDIKNYLCNKFDILLKQLENESK